MGTWFLHDNTGLKGAVAEWAKSTLDTSDLPPNITKFEYRDDNLIKGLDQCNKIIYAFGFHRNPVPTILINGQHFNVDGYNKLTGVIHNDGLFGIGFAFPELITDPYGNQELNVGICDFIYWALQVVPNWIQLNQASTDRSNSQRRTFWNWICISRTHH